MRKQSNRDIRVLVATSVHLPNDARILRQLQSLTTEGFLCTLLAPWAGFEGEQTFASRYFRRRSGLRGRLAAQINFVYTALSKRWDFIHFHDFDLTPAALFIRLISWQRIIYDVHENYAEEVMVRGYLPRWLKKPLRLLVNAIEWLAARIIRRAVLVVPVQVERFSRWGCPRVVLVRNFAPSSFAPSRPNSLETTSSESCVLNSGGQNLEYGALLLLDAAADIYRKSPNVRVRAIDRFEGCPGLRERILSDVSKKAPNYQLLPRVPHQEVGRYLSCAVVGLSLRLNSPNQILAIPTKIFEYMAYGIPIIATDVGYQAEIVRASGAGVLVPPDDPAELAERIMELWHDPELRRKLGESGREAFFSRYSWEPEGRKLVEFYRGNLGR